jgi:hypothetical protein
MRKRIFLYATHPTLVDQESFTFYKRGFDVYTAAWATNTRSQWDAGIKIEFLPNHPYQGKCDFLDDDTLRILSKINVNMSGAIFYPDIQKALVDNFDMLYVSQITPWLMLYSEEFLKRGKHVIFRTFGYPLTAWGAPSNFTSFYKYPTFHIVPTDPAEVTLGTFKDCRSVHQIMASINPELINTMTKLEQYDKFAMTILQLPIHAENSIKELVGRAIPWVCVNRGHTFVRQCDLDKIFNSCEFYLDPTYGLLRYTVFEAIMHNKMVLVIRNMDMHKFMNKTGFSSGLEFFFNGWDDTSKIKFFADNHGMVEQLSQEQSLWFNSLRIEAEHKWDKFLEDKV